LQVNILISTLQPAGFAVLVSGAKWQGNKIRFGRINPILN
jgi:hypothetical protein